MVSSTNGLRNTDNYEPYKKIVKSLVAADVVNVDKAAESLVNRADWDSGKKTVAALGVGEQLPSVAVPSGYYVLLKALKDNTDKINVAESKASSEDDDNSHELQPSDTLTLKVTNVDKIWVDADVNGEGLTWAVEI